MGAELEFTSVAASRHGGEWHFSDDDNETAMSSP
jgi:hypothetical protein